MPTGGQLLRRNSASTGNTRRLLARDHAAPESTLALSKAASLGCGRVRPLAWCSRPRSSAASLEGALVPPRELVIEPPLERRVEPRPVRLAPAAARPAPRAHADHGRRADDPYEGDPPGEEPE